MKKTIYIDNVAFTYSEEKLDYSNTEPMSHEEGRILLEKINDVFTQNGLTFYLGYGTLLGAVRNHDIIPGDEDLDIIVRDEEHLRHILPTLREAGIELIRAFKGNVYSFRMGTRSYIDVYILRNIPATSIWSLYCYSIANKEYCPKKLWKESQEIEFLGKRYLCPKNPERVLEHWYGKDWMTPKSGHNFYYTVKSHYYLKQLKKQIKKLIGYDKWYHLIKK